MTSAKHRRVKALAKVKHAKNKSRRVHQVRRGETLGSIARRYGTSVRALMRANSLRTSRIQAGVALRVPNG
jgi:LysM repeat protein